MTSIAQKLITINNSINNIRDVVKTVDPTLGSGSIDTLSTDVATVIAGGGGVEVPSNMVNFCDYDGTVLYAYPEFPLTTPEGPTHEGLTFQGWATGLSSSYRSIKSPIFIMPMYVTTDGKTKLYIDIPNDLRTSIKLIYVQSANNIVTVDWGDGSATETTTRALSQFGLAHTYSGKGKYVINLSCSTGTYSIGSGGGSGGSIFGGDRNTSNYLYKVELGSNVDGIGNFYYCYNLESITVPNTTQSFTGSLKYCSKLKAVCIPLTSTYLSIGTSVFSYCYNLKHINIPIVNNSGVSGTSATFGTANAPLLQSFNMEYTSVINTQTHATSTIGPTTLIPSGSFPTTLSSLTTLTIPASVTSMGSTAIVSTSLKSLHVTPTTPPMIEADSLSIPSDCKIYVPMAKVSTYKAATNWSALSSQIYSEPITT